MSWTAGDFQVGRWARPSCEPELSRLRAEVKLQNGWAHENLEKAQGLREVLTTLLAAVEMPEADPEYDASGYIAKEEALLEAIALARSAVRSS
jgi:hypothetical protein